MKKIQTNWIVITGVTCSGKTSLIKIFSESGYRVIEEIARGYITEMMSRGILPDELKKDRKVYFEKLFELQIEYELSIIKHSAEIVFLDRAIPDILAYSIVDCFEANEARKKIASLHRYRKIFVLDPLPFIEDGFRSINLRRKDKLNDVFEISYKNLSYDVARIPCLPLEERYECVINQIKNA